MNEITFLYVFHTTTKDYNANTLDTFSKKLYELNEQKKYNKVLILADSVLKIIPFNLTANNEKSLALLKSGRKKEYKKANRYTNKIGKAIFKTGSGKYEDPFFAINFFEGITINGRYYRCYPNKQTLFLNESNILLGAFYCYSSKYDEIIINYINIDHAKEFYPNRVDPGK